MKRQPHHADAVGGVWHRGELLTQFRHCIHVESFIGGEGRKEERIEETRREREREGRKCTLPHSEREERMKGVGFFS